MEILQVNNSFEILKIRTVVGQKCKIIGVGNVGPTASAEFNFFVDPEAANVVLNNFGGKLIYDLPWETMLKMASTYVRFTKIS